MKDVYNSSNQGNRIGKTLFDWNFDHKTTANAGYLFPFFCEDCLPGDTWKGSTEIFARLMPLATPMYQKVKVHTHFFKIPYRLVWSEWKDFFTGGDHNDKSPLMPFITIDTDVKELMGKGSLSDYFGYPYQQTGDSPDYKFNILYHRGYQLTFNEYYRDQNLQEEVNYGGIGSGQLTQIQDITQLLQLRKRSWAKDKFTSLLPEPQKGDPVLLPLQGTAPVVAVNDGSKIAQLETAGGAVITEDINVMGQYNSVVNRLFGVGVLPPNNTYALHLDPNGSLVTDLTQATAIYVNDLRECFAIQRYWEKLARGGSRYIEVIETLFGVKSSDARLQRPEYLGGGVSPIVVSEVVQQSESGTTPQGHLTGHGISVQNSHFMSTFCEEHCMIIGIASIMPEASYSQGVRRMFRKFDRFDYYLPAFAHLGEQPCFLDELFHNLPNYDPVNEAIMGYEPRYNEYRAPVNMVSGEFRDTLENWAMTRKFDNEPQLTEEFLDVDQDSTHAPFAVTTKELHKYILWIQNKFVANRPMPFEADPGYIDHF